MAGEESEASASAADTGDDEAVDQHISAARRTSIHLADRGLLRATTPAVLLAGIGRRMRKSVGGIGDVAQAADDEYAKSFPVEELDIFLSHSWHTWWLLKYLTLLYYFNAVPAVAATTVAGLLFMRFHYHKGGDLGLDDYSDPISIGPNGQVFGTLMFNLTLFSWHHVMALLGRAPNMFLDKVCIHQTNAALKVKGIKSIGAILANSKLMLVAWDSTYFERLWCTYEMSAFRKGNPNGRIKVLPVVLGLFTVGYQAATWLADMMVRGVRNHTTWNRGNSIFKLSALLHLPMFILCMRIMARYINNLRKLKMQLATFSVRSAKCFCCDARHIHPDTGAQLPCDREVVNNSIENWMGLDTFDRMVRGDFKRFVKRTLGGRAKVPYRYAVAASVYPGFALMDHMVESKRRLDWWLEVLIVFEATYLRHPLMIGVMVALLFRYQDSIQVRLSLLFRYVHLGETTVKWTLYTLAGMLCAAFYYMLLMGLSYVTMVGPAAVVAWLLVEACCISCLYFGGLCWDRTPMALWTQPLWTEAAAEHGADDLGRVRSTLPGRGRSTVQQQCALELSSCFRERSEQRQAEGLGG